MPNKYDLSDDEKSQFMNHLLKSFTVEWRSGLKSACACHESSPITLLHPPPATNPEYKEPEAPEIRLMKQTGLWRQYDTRSGKTRQTPCDDYIAPIIITTQQCFYINNINIEASQPDTTEWKTEKQKPETVVTRQKTLAILLRRYLPTSINCHRNPGNLQIFNGCWATKAGLLM